MSLSHDRDKNEEELKEMENALLSLTQDELAARAELDQVVESLPRVPRESEVQFTTTNLASLRQTLKRYQLDYARLQARCIEIRSGLDSRYEDFQESYARNLRRLRELASSYGEAFLGDPCEFVEAVAPGELHSFTFFVPRFADEPRTVPGACSESERFFLDIAFRMALIELAGELVGKSATFICETPENALDLAYTDNVAEMFRRFASKSFSLLLTANIQAGGVALPLLRKYRPLERKRRIFNLISEATTLTAVQKRKERDFERELRNILEGA